MKIKELRSYKKVTKFDMVTKIFVTSLAVTKSLFKVTNYIFCFVTC